MNIHKASEQLHQQFVGNVYEIRAVPALISYLHAAAGNIPKVTWVKRVASGFYAGWPGLTEQRVRRWLTKEESAMLEATTMGHQKLVSQNIRPTNRPPKKEHDVSVVIMKSNEMDEELRNLVAMDLPGRFPITSASGYKYIFIIYNWDASYIKPVLMKLRETDKIL